MESRQLEGLIKSSLASYRDDYNLINKDRDENPSIDFSFKITKHWFDPSKTKRKDYKGEDDGWKKYKAMKPQHNYYLRMVRFEVEVKDGKESVIPGSEKLIFMAYRPELDFKKKTEQIRRSLLKECMVNLIIGGVEYAEAIYQMEHEAKQKQKEKEVATVE
jgi:hypothetical protein